MKVIGCTGFACAGKDTFYKLLYDIDRNCVRFAFADELKAKVGPFLSSVLGWDVFNLTQEQKKIVRPLLVWLGATMRYFDKDYWVKALHQKLQETPIDLYMIPVLTDMRYANEAAFFKKNYDCFLVKIEREGVGPANDEEAKNQPEVEPYVDHTIKWSNETDIQKLRPYVEEAYRKFLAHEFVV